MKNILAFLVLIGLFSCAPVKKVVTTGKTEHVTNTQNAIVDNNTIKIDDKNTIVDQSNTEIEIVTEITSYDTSKPNVPGTDNPPVKEKKKITEKRSNKANIKTSSEAIKTEEAKHIDNSNIQKEDKEKIIIKENPKTPTIAYWFWIGIFAVVVAGLLFIRKYWAKIKSILVNIIAFFKFT